MLRRSRRRIVLLVALFLGIALIVLLRLAAPRSWILAHPPFLLETLLLIGLGVVLVILALWLLPKWQVARLKGLRVENRFDRENEARKTLAQIIGGVLLLAGLYSSVRTLDLQRVNVDLQREGQITDRFTKAIDQLGAVQPGGAVDADGKPKINLEVRLGGIYALDRIAHESAEDQSVIMEVLTAYVRDNSNDASNVDNSGRGDIGATWQFRFSGVPPIKSVESGFGAQKAGLRPGDIITSMDGQSIRHYGSLVNNIVPREPGTTVKVGYLRNGEQRETTVTIGDIYKRLGRLLGSEPPMKPRADIQSILTVIGRRDLTHDSGILDLGQTNLAGIHLSDANLLAVNLRRAKLHGVEFHRANLRRADLIQADLSGAVLNMVDLSNSVPAASNLSRAFLQDVNLSAARLNDANFNRAMLSRVNFSGAYLIGADLTGTTLLPGVNFSGADLTGADLSKMILRPGIKDSGAEPHFGDRAELISQPGVNFSGARLNEADLSGADLRLATGLTQAQLNGAHGDAETKLPPGLTRPDSWSK